MSSLNLSDDTWCRQPVGCVAQVFARASPDLGPLDVVVHSLQTVVAPRLRGSHVHLRTRATWCAPRRGCRSATPTSWPPPAATNGFTYRALSPLYAVTAAALAVGIYDVAVDRMASWSRIGTRIA